jgi:GNAT superfamily N-acetyltransferase
VTPCSLSPADADAVFALFAAAQLHDTGSVVIELEDILGAWQRPSFDLASQAIGVRDGDMLVAGGEVYRARRAQAAVLPEHRGRGIGSWLAGWLEEAARRDGGTVVGQTVPVGSGAERFFEARGYAEGWTSWVLELPAGRSIAPQPLPDGYTIRDVAPGVDDEVAFWLVEDAFNEWPERQPSTLADWAAGTIRRPGFEPWQLRLVVDGSGTPVGSAYTILAGDCGYVDQLAVRKDHRGRGLARALLADAFERARARGAARSELATDSRTGALDLYQHVGMVVTQTWRHWQTDL